MAHIDLRALDDDDLDAVAALTSEPGALPRAWSGTDLAALRDAGDGAVWIVTENGAFAGVAAASAIDGRREATYGIASHARGRGVGTAVLRLLAAREAERPLYVRVTDADAPAAAMLERIGFTDASDVPATAPGERVFVLPPTLE